MPQDYLEINRRAWTDLAIRGWPSARPYGSHHFAHAQDLLDPHGWIPWETISHVLCLGGGGGQQVPLLAALGCRVTGVDLCPEQLVRDRVVADRYGLEAELIEGDMLNLSLLHGREFDLVYQALSASYVPDVRRLYREVAQVLRPGGYYRVEHPNPVTMQLPNLDVWDGSAYRLVRPQLGGEPVPWAVPGAAELGSPAVCWHYIHALHDLIGGLGDAGFILLHFAERAAADLSAEPGTYSHLTAYVPPFFTLFAQLAPNRQRRSSEERSSQGIRRHHLPHRHRGDRPRASRNR